MYKTLGIAVTLLTTASIFGCGGGDDGGSNSTTAATQQPTAPTHTATTHTTQPVTATYDASTPHAAVTAFLEALKGGDKATTEALLTRKARAETTAHDLIVEPPGAPGATYSVNGVDPVEGDDKAAYVSCVWSEKENNSEFEVVWIVRQEETEWRIAGMATQLPGLDEPIILNFEDLSELEQAMREAEVADRQQQPAAGDGQPSATLCSCCTDRPRYGTL